MKLLMNELIQVAAVAVAIVEDLCTQEGEGAEGDAWTDAVLIDVRMERERQNRKWGAQHHTPMEWLAILGEEVGEANKAALEAHTWPPRQQEVFDREAP